jgi:hypothetical protein
MLLEWLRRHMGGWEDDLRTYLFTNEPVIDIEEGDEDSEELQSASCPEATLGIGSMKDERGGE